MHIKRLKNTLTNKICEWQAGEALDDDASKGVGYVAVLQVAGLSNEYRDPPVRPTYLVSFSRRFGEAEMIDTLYHVFQLQSGRRFHAQMTIVAEHQLSSFTEWRVAYPLSPVW
jgi:hypothetical protein